MSSESELNKSRGISDGELLSGGAELVPGANGPRLKPTPEQLIDASRQGPKPEVTESQSEIDRHYEWIRAHMWQYASGIKAKYGSLEAFERELSAGAKVADNEEDEEIAA